MSEEAEQLREDLNRLREVVGTLIGYLVLELGTEPARDLLDKLPEPR